ncbi:MAG: peptide ABC transporter substrate-binding protein, partial [Planctomycetes bacterium]|nr:peptide ABC transporter substrate-binding protein [Planctomycetota bacterium]
MDAHSLARKARVGLALGLLLALFAGAISMTRGAKLEKADFTFNNGTEVQSLDPAKVTGTPEGRIIRLLYEGLVIKNPRDLSPEPGMAESWDISPDGRIYTMHLRQGSKWTNGDEVTAMDFEWSMKRMLHPKTAAEYAYQLWYVKGAKAYTSEVDDLGEPKNDPDTVAIRALDRYTLEIELNSRTPFFMELLGFYPVFPVNRRALEEAKEKWPVTWEIEWLKPENIVTNGPWKLHSRRVNDRIRVVKNEDYWDADNVAFNTIDALAMEQTSTGLNLYLTGGTDFIEKVSDELIRDLMPREDFNPEPYLGIYFYRINTTKPPFDDKRVRRALSLVVPRDLICDQITKSGQVPAYSFVPPMAIDYTSPQTEKGPDTGTPEERQAARIQRARELLAEAGYGPGLKPMPPVELHYNTLEAHKKIAETIMSAWRDALDIEVKLRNEEWKVYLDTQSNLNYELSRSAWIGDYMDPNTFVDLFLTGGENNKTGWGNPEYDRLVHGSNQESDPSKRLHMLEQAEAILMDELPIIPIYYYVTQNMVAPRLGGFYANPEDEHFPKFWYWMDDEELAAKRAAQPAD